MTAANIEALMRLGFTYVLAILILTGGYHALVLSPFELSDLVQGAIIGFMGAVVQFVFGAQIAATTAAATTKALMTPAPPETPPAPTDTGGG